MEYFSMKQNTDGSSKLGTLQTTAILALAQAHNAKVTEQYTAGYIEQPQYELELIDIDAINTAKLAVDAEVTKFVAVIKRTLDNRLKVRIVPNEPASTENVEVPFILDTYVSYMKRKNPTRSASVQQAAKDALALKLANERRVKLTELKTQLVALEQGSEEYNKVLDAIITM
jgi:hypothetical protein